MRDFIDKTETTAGTPINRDNLMAIQGFDNVEITFTENSVIEYNPITKTTKTTTFLPNGNIIEKFEGEKVITKTITFESNKITEVIS